MLRLVILMFALWTIAAGQDADIGFIEEPITTIAKIGDQVRLRCNGNSSNEKITWYRNDVMISTESSGSRRQRRKRNKEDLSVLDPTVTFDLHPEIDSLAKSAKARTSYDTRFSKKAKRRKDRRKGKKRDKSFMKSANRYVRSLDGNVGNVQIRFGRLFIQRFTEENVGAYHCVVTTPNGSIRSRVSNLQMAGMSDFSLALRATVTALRGETAVLSCALPESKPKAEPRWKVDNISWINKTTGLHTILPSGSLVLKNVTSSVGKHFHCCAYNPTMDEIKCAKGVTTLTVTEPPSSRKREIVFPLSRSTDMVADGDSRVLLECVTSDRSKASWNREGSDLPSSAEITEDGLLFPRVLESDSGTYTCQLSEGGAQHAFHLTVTGKPSISSHGLENGTLRCSTLDSSKPKWSWYHNAKKINNAQGPTINESQVISLGGGYYQCFAVPDVATSADYAIFFVKDPDTVTLPSTSDDYFTASTDEPGLQAPRITNPEGTSKPTSYKLTWEVDDIGENLKLFSIKYYKFPGESSQPPKVINLPANKRSIVIESLLPQSTYVVEMISVYQNNLRSGKAISSFYTAKEIIETSSRPPVKVPPKNPGRNKDGNSSEKPRRDKKGKNLPRSPTRPTVTAISADSVSLMWNRGGNGGSPIQGYRIQSKRVNTKEDWNTIVKFITTDYPPYELSGLERGSIYKFRIVAVNANGDSSPSTPSRSYPRRAKPPIEPLMMTPFIIDVTTQGETDIVITWKYRDYPPSSIGGYTVFYRSSDSDDERDYKEEKVNDGSATSYVIKGLEPEMQYDIKIQAFNSLGKSPFSNVMIIELPETGGVIVRANGRLSTPARDATTLGNSGPNDPARERAYHRNTMFLITGAVIGLVLIVLLVTVFCYWRRRSNQNLTPEMKQRNGSASGYTKGKCGNHLGMTKLNGNPSGSDLGTHTPNSYSQSPHDTRCQCSRHHSNHSSLDRSGGDFCQCGIQPCNGVHGHGGCSPHNGCWTPGNYPNIHSNPMQAYMDHRIPYYPHGLGRGLAVPAVPPSWWLRGAGDFCHIVPGDARKLSGGDEGSEVNRGIPRNGGHMVRTFVGNVTSGYYDDEVSPNPDNGYHSNEDGLGTTSASKGERPEEKSCQDKDTASLDVQVSGREQALNFPDSKPEHENSPEIRRLSRDVVENTEEDSGRGEDMTDDAHLNVDDVENLSAVDCDEVDENTNFLNRSKETVAT